MKLNIKHAEKIVFPTIFFFLILVFNPWFEEKKEDLSPLKDEIVFALNNFYVHDIFLMY